MGAYSDDFLDGDILTDRHQVWSGRLAAPAATARTVLAEDADGLAGFIHLMLDEHPHRGSLVDNLHIRPDRQRTGLGSLLLRRAAAAVTSDADSAALHLWVQEQNRNARHCYTALGATAVERTLITPPGGIPNRLNGTPAKLRMAWPDVRDSPLLP